MKIPYFRIFGEQVFGKGHGEWGPYVFRGTVKDGHLKMNKYHVGENSGHWIIYEGKIAEGKFEGTLKTAAGNDGTVMLESMLDKKELRDFYVEVFKCLGHFVEECDKCVTEKLPKLLELCKKYPQELTELKDRAGPEIDKMDFGNKIKCTKALIENAAMISKIPTLVEDAINNLKADLIHLAKHSKKLGEELP